MALLKTITKEDILNDLRYLELLAQKFKNIADASTEIINLEAILNLPKGTEHFLADIHGEYEAFQHVLKNGSGSIKRKVNDIFGDTLQEAEKKELCTLIYYPQEKLKIIKSKNTNPEEWYMLTLYRLISICRNVSSKYTRSKVRKALPPEFSYIIQELLHESSTEPNKHDYINVIVSTIISLGRTDEFIITLGYLIQRFIIDSLHIVGDIYDRGPGAHIIMDTLCNYHNLDIQWGNHDILWMGAAAGNDCCIANVVRICLRYGNLPTLEEGYGINLLPLATFSMETYGKDSCRNFTPKLKNTEHKYDAKTIRLISQMHKTISIIQFKLEAQAIDRRPEFGLQDRKLLEHIDRIHGTLHYQGKNYPMLDTNFPTVQADDPYRLTDDETELVEKLHRSFVNSTKLQKHMHCLYANGSMYKICNSNLLYHASIPLCEDGNFKHVYINGQGYYGKSLLDKIDQLARLAYFGSQDSPEQPFALDYMWYLWCGPDSPLFDKDKMATFENYFLEDKEMRNECKGWYYSYREEEATCNRIFEEFGINGKHSHIINGHVPVKVSQGELPMRANGKMLLIDGGFSKAYQSKTGIAGYTLVYHSHGFQLVQHEPFESTQKAIEEGLDIKSTSQIIEFSTRRMLVKDMDKGKELKKQIENLQKLLYAYRYGFIKEIG